MTKKEIVRCKGCRSWIFCEHAGRQVCENAKVEDMIDRPAYFTPPPTFACIHGKAKP